MKNKVLDAIRKYSLIMPGNTIIAAVSGGPDSMAMLHVFQLLRAHWDVKIHVAHFNHMFRGEEAEEEAAFVTATAKKMGLGCTVESFDVPLYVRESDLSPEEGARFLRYQFLQRVARDLKADLIMTAHHANDQAETVLLHLLRGTGPEGLAAISPREGNLIRPMLGVTKEDIMAYCQEYHLEYRLDPSNNEEIYTRNKIRLSLLPYLEKFNPQIVHSLVKTADICRQENDFLRDITGAAMSQITRNADDQEVIINFSQLKCFHHAVQRRLIRQVLDEFTGIQGNLSFDHTEEILQLKSGKELCLPGPLYGRREGERLVISRVKRPHQRVDRLLPLSIKVPGITLIPELDVSVMVKIIDWPDAGYSQQKSAGIFNIRILEQPLWIRNRYPGDCLRLKGMKGRKKLKDFFIDEKISWEERDRIPIILSGDEIIWVVGHRMGAGTRVCSEDKKAVMIIVEES